MFSRLTEHSNSQATQRSSFFDLSPPSHSPCSTMPALHSPFWVEGFLLLHLPAGLMIGSPEERLLVRQVMQPVFS